MKFTIVAFKHPDESKSVLYRQNLTLEGLKKAIDDAVAHGANLMSIRGFP
jgi:hypothetical protein